MSTAILAEYLADPAARTRPTVALWNARSQRPERPA